VGISGNGIGILGNSASGPSIVAQGNADAPALIALGNYQSATGGVTAANLATITSANKGFAAVLSGKVLVTDAVNFSGVINGTDAIFSQVVQANVGTFTGQIASAGASFTGNVSVTGTVTATGNISATAGNVSAKSATFSETVTAGTVTATGNISAPAGSLSAKSATFTGTVTASDVILAGADCAEQFDIAEGQFVDPGTVLVINDNGTLRPCSSGHDRRVVGVVSGAGTYQPGIVLDKRADSTGRAPIALVGKVFCKVDAGDTSIAVGDLLTTSSTPGHAMKATDPISAFGAVLGKALGPLDRGRGLIPILVALQ
jgi:hypothetical protein